MLRNAIIVAGNNAPKGQNTQKHARLAEAETEAETENEPNGIRTHVSSLKGRCPGPG